ncbi:type II toxin-antitoxin system RelE/ParE family toxin [Mesorhizobium sp. BR1-1-9]|uniref:type II toxin-antitoxin system RelE/ParE family toxin n=1 Tax=unclassified Mesorhizobium TaxID=325217 RepID=UPI001129C776|nr:MULTISPECIES: type II toxin-antitoxin system RelE/ParE family toxin [unclassified Mesorhizobium]MBZ9807946.1 type II toxin-antitoxin system RelE/ParE family toxin [Mesorhizobium sp. ESP-6-2]MBZ9874695.1 type II toxin-antitoxin system RelE/ParE family toxin [Mesorhizobium sp. BR1-1-9]MBZ9941726.1 type II toxin-antitoxin system RelE/ParE family toxin [Mesorhizobium sp. BR1-1-13]TPM31071.1 type II toxin-antitoxin system RelE/ParE family toxin [Mesorhizobium sp. B2-2-2]
MIRRLEVEYRESANNDLANIFKHIVEAGGNPDVALRFVLRIEDRCHNIGNAPRGGRSRDDMAPGLRTVPFEHSAVIAYVIESDVISIVNIFYGGRDYETLMRDGGSSDPS